MAKTLKATATASLHWSYMKMGDLTTAPTQEDGKVAYTMALTAGTAAKQVDALWRDVKTVTEGSPNYDLDLIGILEDSFGDVVNVVEVTGLIIKNLATAAGDKLVVGGQGSSAWNSFFDGSDTAKVRVGPEGVLFACNPVDGYAVVATTEDVLRIAYAGTSGSISFEVAVMGRTA